MLGFALLVGIVTSVIAIVLAAASLLFPAQRLAFAAWIGYLAVVIVVADAIVLFYTGDLSYVLLAGMWTFIAWMNLKRAGRI